MDKYIFVDAWVWLALSKTFKKGLSNEGYATHTLTLRKPKYRLSNRKDMHHELAKKGYGEMK
ncbi:MAG: hypothetical protein L6244_05775 [Candidatus Methanoperedenaceae archaeon]|nr:hypothetical protein [Candidatus Methanoperedenaceae archaeon]